MENEASGLRWWDEELLHAQVSFATAFFPALLRACDPQSLPSELSRDELRVVTQFCISPDANQVTREDFRRFLARFGPLELSLATLVACFCVNREVVPWFHGEISRQEAEKQLAARERSDGAFLVRFSESHPTKFTLTYLKVHSASSSTPGRRELKNCLVRNLGEPGYALSEAMRRGGSSVRQRTYPSIGAFIQSSSGRLKYGVASGFSAKCNQELATVRAMQDHQSDSYTAFSTESFGNPEPCHDAASMLFSRSPSSLTSFLGTSGFPLNGNSKAGTISDSYASFTLESLAQPTILRVETSGKAAPPSVVEGERFTVENWNDGKVNPPPGRFVSSDYGNFASFAQPEEEDQPIVAMPANTSLPQRQLNRSPSTSISDEYASFASLASTYAHESQQLASRGQQTLSLSRSPSSTASTAQSGFDASGYGSFTNIAVTKPASSTPVDANYGNDYHISTNRGPPAESDYGSFTTTEVEDKITQWVETLGPPPPPPTAVKTSSDRQTTPPSNAIYGNFASLSLEKQPAAFEAKKASNASPKKPRVPESAPNSEVYGSFDAVAAPTTKTTPITSALDELNIGMEFYKQKRLDDALLRFILAQELARSTGEQVVEARALGNLGTVYLDQKNPQQAVRCYQQCLDITRAIEDTKRERTILNNLVLALVASEDFERALNCCQVQLETTSNAINRRKIISRMSLLREKMTRQTTP